MNLYLQVRQAFGFSQEVLAQLLGVQTGLFKMAETNRRTLPAHAMQRLVWMLDFVQNLPDNSREDFAQSEAFPADAVAELLHKIKKQKRKLDKILDASQQKKKQMQNRFLFQEAFLQKFPADTHQAETSRLNALILEAESYFIPENSEDELLIKARQVGIEAIIAFLEKQA